MHAFDLSNLEHDWIIANYRLNHIHARRLRNDSKSSMVNMVIAFPFLSASTTCKRIT